MITNEEKVLIDDVRRMAIKNTGQFQISEILITISGTVDLKND